MLSWWCSGQIAEPWSWAPRLYVGIWLVMIGIGLGYLWLVRDSARRTGERIDRGRAVVFVIGWATLWVATDWPLGALSAGYLLSASMIQVVVYVYVAAPLMVYGMPPAIRERWLIDRSPWNWIVRRPLVAFVVFQACLVITHVPAIADSLKALQLGTMLMDGIWLGAALLFWWSLDTYRPASSGRRFGVRIMFVLLSKAAPTALGVVLAYDNFPWFTTYEFANRVWPSMTALQDQQAAGLIMWMGMAPLIPVRIAILFAEWARAERPDLPTEVARPGACRPEGDAHD